MPWWPREPFSGCLVLDGARIDANTAAESLNEAKSGETFEANFDYLSQGSGSTNSLGLRCEATQGNDSRPGLHPGLGLAAQLLT